MTCLGLGTFSNVKERKNAWKELVDFAEAQFKSKEFYNRFDEVADLNELRVRVDALGSLAVYCFDDGIEKSWIGLIWADFENETVNYTHTNSTTLMSFGFEDFVSSHLLDFIEDCVEVGRKQVLQK